MDDYEGWWTSSVTYRSGNGHGDSKMGYQRLGNDSEYNNVEIAHSNYGGMFITVGSDQYLDGNGGSYMPKDYRYKGL